jgi:hypothetical protein
MTAFIGEKGLWLCLRLMILERFDAGTDSTGRSAAAAHERLGAGARLDP